VVPPLASHQQAEAHAATLSNRGHGSGLSMPSIPVPPAAPDPTNEANLATVAAELAAAYAELQNLLLDSSDLTDFLHQAAVLAASVIPGSSCGITFRHSRGNLTVASSDIRAAQVDELQYTAGQGPCLDAMHTGQEVSVPDLVSESRWADYRLRAIAAGIASSISFPLILPDNSDSVGALNLYSGRPQAFDDHPSVNAGRVFARQAATAITLVLRHTNQAVLHNQLREALATRAVIDQALGILMGARRITSDAAFAILREASHHQNRKLADIAEDIIRSFTGQPSTPPRPFTNPR
jgi:GAF domain-containing protein